MLARKLIMGSGGAIVPISLLHFDANFSDVGSLGLTWSDNASNTHSINTTTKKFGAGSLDQSHVSNTTPDKYGIIPSSVTWCNYSADFSFELWYNHATESSVAKVFLEQSDGTATRGFRFTRSTTAGSLIVLFTNAAGTNLISTTVTGLSGAFHHIYCEKDGNTVRFAVDGTFNAATGNISSNAPTPTYLDLGGVRTGTLRSSGAEIDEFAAWDFAKHKGVNFTPPIAAY